MVIKLIDKAKLLLSLNNVTIKKSMQEFVTAAISYRFSIKYRYNDRLLRYQKTSHL